MHEIRRCAGGDNAGNQVGIRPQLTQVLNLHIMPWAMEGHCSVENHMHQAVILQIPAVTVMKMEWRDEGMDPGSLWKAIAIVVYAKHEIDLC